MLKNLFSKKKDGFYMQASDVQLNPAQPADKTEAAPAAVAEVAIAAPTETSVAEAAPAPKSAAPSKKTSIKKDKKKDKEPSAQPVVAPAPVAAAPPAVVTNFSTDYLIKPSSNSSRRRPGANMKSFVTMARDVKK